MTFVHRPCVDVMYTGLVHDVCTHALYITSVHRPCRGVMYRGLCNVHRPRTSVKFKLLEASCTLGLYRCHVHRACTCIMYTGILQLYCGTARPSELSAMVVNIPW